MYQALRKQCQNFATALLDHTRSSGELGELQFNAVINIWLCPASKCLFHTQLWSIKGNIQEKRDRKKCVLGTGSDGILVPDPTRPDPIFFQLPDPSRPEN